MPSTTEAVALVRAFDASPEEEKSRELILTLLEFTAAAFSRDRQIDLSVLTGDCLRPASPGPSFPACSENVSFPAPPG